MALTSEAQKIAARPRKTRTWGVFLREHRHAILDADLQHLLAHSARQEPGGPEPGEAGRLALATLWQASGHVGERDAVELPVLDKRWPRGRDGRGAAPPPCSQGPLCPCRRRRIAHAVAQSLRDCPVALAEQTGGCGARQRRAVLDSPPRVGAGRVEDPLPLRGHALRQAVGLAAQALGPATMALSEAAGLTLGGHRSLQAALDLDGGEPSARARARGLGLEEGARWPHGRAPPPTLAVQVSPIQEGMETITQRITPETAPAPEGGPEGRRITPPVAPDRRLASEEKARRHGRQSSATTCHGFQEHGAVDLESTVPREVVVRPAHAPAHAAGERRAETLEHAPGLWQLASDLGDMASPRIAPWAEQGGDMRARPWPHVGPLCTKQACLVDCAARPGTCPGGHTVPPGPRQGCPVSGGGGCQGSLARPVHDSHARARQEACTSVQMRRASSHGAPRCRPSEDGPRCAHGPR
jgi:hypothetical protein